MGTTYKLVTARFSRTTPTYWVVRYDGGREVSRSTRTYPLAGARRILAACEGRWPMARGTIPILWRHADGGTTSIDQHGEVS